MLRTTGEVTRDEKQPSPKGWVVSKCLPWLESHPIPVPSVDAAYLKGVVLEIKGTILRKFSPSVDGSSKGRNWYGEIPILRLIHTLLEDDIKDKWIHQHDPMTREELDGRKSVVREATVFEMIADR